MTICVKVCYIIFNIAVRYDLVNLCLCPIVVHFWNVRESRYIHMNDLIIIFGLSSILTTPLLFIVVILYLTKLHREYISAINSLVHNKKSIKHLIT